MEDIFFSIEEGSCSIKTQNNYEINCSPRLLFFFFLKKVLILPHLSLQIHPTYVQMKEMIVRWYHLKVPAGTV